MEQKWPLNSTKMVLRVEILYRAESISEHFSFIWQKKCRILNFENIYKGSKHFSGWLINTFRKHTQNSFKEKAFCRKPTGC